jgi:hypothetical protein
MRALVALFVLVGSVTASLAADIRVGTTMHVKQMQIWFEEDAEGKLAEWQAKRKGNAKAFAAYQRKLTAEREAWQFGGPHEVEILKFEPAQKRVQVRMTTEGRLQDSVWWLDPEAITK